MHTLMFIEHYTSSLLILLVTLNLALLVFLLILTRKLKTFMRGAHATSLEPLIVETREAAVELLNHDKEIGIKMLALEKKITTLAKSPSILRYKGMESNASNQSFSIALLDEEGNGVVLSALHVRDTTHLYAKEVTAFESKRELTEEEKLVIRDARVSN